METTVHEGRPEAGPDRDLELLIEKGFLLLGSIEFQIDEHLMSHGTRISPETRLFMAQVRDAAGDAATKLLDEARIRLESAPAAAAVPEPDRAPEPAAEAAAGEPAGARLLPANRSHRTTVQPRGPRRFAFGRAATNAGLGAAAAALILAVLLSGRVPSGAPTELSDGAHVAAAESAPDAAVTSAMAPRHREASAAMRAARGPGEPRTGSADGAPMLFAPAPLAPQPHALEPYILAAVVDVAQSRAGDRGPLAGTLAEPSLRPDQSDGQPPYPDPRAGPERSEVPPVDSQSAAEIETSLALSLGVRREVQRRLALSEFNPQAFDGIFGPVTRAALGEWQRASGIPATGFLDASALALLRDRTEDAYRTSQAEEARLPRQETLTVLTSPMPPVSPLRTERCRRTRSGKIVYGRGVRCDFRGLRQSIARLFG